MNHTLKKLVRKIVGFKKIQEQIVVEADIQKGDRVMDVGCGRGMLYEELHENGLDVEYMGIEPDETKRLYAEQHYALFAHAKFKRAFALHLPSVQDYYTHVICMLSFHHFPKDEWVLCLKEVVRVLQPGGKLIIVDFGRPKGIIGYFLWCINPCRKISSGIEGFLIDHAQEVGITLVSKKQQFGYITHLIFTK